MCNGLCNALTTRRGGTVAGSIRCNTVARSINPPRSWRVDYWPRPPDRCWPTIGSGSCFDRGSCCASTASPCCSPSRTCTSRSPPVSVAPPDYYSARLCPPWSSCCTCISCTPSASLSSCPSSSSSSNADDDGCSCVFCALSFCFSFCAPFDDLFSADLCSVFSAPSFSPARSASCSTSAGNPGPC